MSNILRIVRDDDNPEVRWPGHVPIDRTGAELAVELLKQLETESVDEDVGLRDLAHMGNWARQGRPYRNLLAEYVQLARAAGPAVESAFLAVIGDWVALCCDPHSVPNIDSSHYAEMLEDGDDDTRVQS